MSGVREAPWGQTAPTFLGLAALRRAGMTRAGIARSVASGTLIRARNGRYVVGGTHPDLEFVARLGGRLDCVSLLRHLGVFVLDGSSMHMQVDTGASRLPTPPSGVVRHWRVSRARRDALVADLTEALAQAVRCQGPREAVATLDSAWHLGLIDDEGLALVFERLPERYRVLRFLLDRRSESGSESLMRLVLRTLDCHVDVQVKIPGVGRVDFVVDGWLIIECDSERFHSTWEAQKRDRRRDLAAAARGYGTIRILAEDIFYHRDEVRAALQSTLAHRTALRRAGARR
ncbi:hypothetical protein [Microbacterium timonense]|uniref:hypothetical protein n=1 Tax=Microbacterium timonense TaxID=2086576 RepID=UPI001F3D5787|nr:hypothetical protein [Microbacterium timonense]